MFFSNKFNKVLISAFLTLVFVLPMTMLSFGAEEINLIKVNVELQDDGSAHITQIWDVYTDSGTEFYIPMGNMRDMQVQNFTVKDETGRIFDFQDDWDINASLEEKAYKNGFNYTGGDSFEMCWGKGSYGSHTYTLSYTLTNMVQSYPDYDGFLVRFINSNMSPAPKMGKVVITRAGVDPKESFVATETGVFGFGYSGYINVLDGQIVAETDQSMDESNSMTLMVRLPKGLLNPVSAGSGTFSDLEERAKEGSDYTEEFDGAPPSGGSYDDNSYNSGFIGPFMTMATVFLFMLFGLVGKAAMSTKNAITPLLSDYKKLAPKYKDLNYYRNLPMDNNLEATEFALRNSGHAPKEQDIMGAFILKLIKDGAFTVQKDVQARSFFRDKESTSIRLNPETKITDANEQTFYRLIERAAGSDGLLQENEMKKFARKNYKEIDLWLEQIKRDGEIAFGDMGGYTNESEKKFLGTRFYKKITDQGVSFINNTLGFKKYLEDFTLIAERETKEVALWDGYLVFAALFGIADKVAEEMKRIYPDFEQVSEITGHGNTDLFTTMYLMRSMNRAMASGYRDAKYQSQGGSRSSGGGGGASFGGGGGFSGGGFGGGSR